MSSPPTRSRPARKPKVPKPNPISTAIAQWLESLPSSVIPLTGQYSKDRLREELTASAPKRWTVYHPMVLLPAGSFRDELWENVLYLVGEAGRDRLWGLVLGEIERAGGSGLRLDRLAVNEGIPAAVARKAEGGEEFGIPVDGGGEGEGGGGGEEGAAQEVEEGKEGELGREGEENFIRAPTNLRILRGDFGPEPTAESRMNPTEDDFGMAFWVSTRQNGIVQTWAPRYTMFSRGNVKEKDRLLKFHQGRSDRVLRRKGAFAVDLYAGIGYFAFSYARLGLRVLCWEINPWSVEALRRGAVLNGWTVRVARPGEFEHAGEVVWFGDGETGESGEDEEEEDREEGKGPRIVVFLESNEMAEGRMCDVGAGDFEADVVHVNCGLLPTSEPTWGDAWSLVSSPEGWLHLHENVGVEDIEARKREIQGMFDRWEMEGGGGGRSVVEHLELVKTYAPGVWHCVFDVHVVRSSE